MPAFWMPSEPLSLTLLSVLPTLNLMFNEIYIMQAMFNLFVFGKEKDSITSRTVIFKYAAPILQ